MVLYLVCEKSPHLQDAGGLHSYSAVRVGAIITRAKKLERGNSRRLDSASFFSNRNGSGKGGGGGWRHFVRWEQGSCCWASQQMVGRLLGNG